MRKYLKWIALIAIMFIMSCTPGMQRGYVNVSTIGGGIERICDRHDKMLTGELDPSTLTPEKKQFYLRSTGMLRDVIKEARKTK